MYFLQIAHSSEGQEQPTGIDHQAFAQVPICGWILQGCGERSYFWTHKMTALVMEPLVMPKNPGLFHAEDRRSCHFLGQATPLGPAWAELGDPASRVDMLCIVMWLLFKPYIYIYTHTMYTVYIYIYIHIYIYIYVDVYIYLNTYMQVYMLRKPASWLVAVCERSENRGCGGVVAEVVRNLVLRWCLGWVSGAFWRVMYH